MDFLIGFLGKVAHVGLGSPVFPHGVIRGLHCHGTQGNHLIAIKDPYILPTGRGLEPKVRLDLALVGLSVCMRLICVFISSVSSRCIVCG